MDISTFCFSNHAAFWTSRRSSARMVCHASKLRVLGRTPDLSHASAARTSSDSPAMSWSFAIARLLRHRSIDRFVQIASEQHFGHISIDCVLNRNVTELGLFAQPPISRRIPRWLGRVGVEQMRSWRKLDVLQKLHVAHGRTITVQLDVDPSNRFG